LAQKRQVWRTSVSRLPHFTPSKTLNDFGESAASVGDCAGQCAAVRLTALTDPTDDEADQIENRGCSLPLSRITNSVGWFGVS
jgi:hypothetical protein